MKQPRLTFWQIWNMSFGFLGIQFGFALQNANVSRILQTLGADVHQLSWFWLAAPVTGLIVQPIIGHYSDRTWGRLGRRRPYFLIGAILASLALIFMPNSPAFASFIPPLFIAAGMLMFMDASINVSMEPFRALVADNLPSEQRTQGFAVQSFFIGIGAVVGSVLPYVLTNWFQIPNTAAEGQIPDSVKWSFYFGAFVFITSVVWTVVRTKEYPPDEYKKYHPVDENQAAEEKGGLLQIFKDIATMPKTMVQLAFVQFFSWFALFAMWVFTTPAVTQHVYDTQINQPMVEYLQSNVNQVLDTIPDGELKERYQHINEELQSYQELFAEGEEKVPVNITLANFFLRDRIVNERSTLPVLLTTLSKNEAELPDKETVLKATEELEAIREKYNNNAEEVPRISAETLDIFIEQKFDLPDETLQKLSTIRELKVIDKQYNEGADWVGILFGAYNGFAALFAFLLPLVAKKTSRKITHAAALLLGAAGLLSIYFIQNPTWLLVSMVGIGIAWASILSLPYAMLAGALPSGKMGIYMGIFNFFIVIPQIINGIIGGPVLDFFFSGKAIFALIISGVSMILGALLVTVVNDVDAPNTQ